MSEVGVEDIGVEMMVTRAPRLLTSDVDGTVRERMRAIERASPGTFRRYADKPASAARMLCASEKVIDRIAFLHETVEEGERGSEIAARGSESARRRGREKGARIRALSSVCSVGALARPHILNLNIKYTRGALEGIVRHPPPRVQTLNPAASASPANVPTALPRFPTKIPGATSARHPFDRASAAAVAGPPTHAFDPISASAFAMPKPLCPANHTIARWHAYRTPRYRNNAGVEKICETLPPAAPAEAKNT
eukprot:31498-Pelagococcus_subviridis.AAC.14